MNDTEVEVTLADHRNEIGSLKHRMNDVEKIVDSVHQLANEMVGLTKEMHHTNKAIERLNEDVAELKKKAGTALGIGNYDNYLGVSWLFNFNDFLGGNEK